MKHTQKVLAFLFITASACSDSSSGAGWVRTWGGSGDDNAACIAMDGSTNLYVGGKFNGTVNFNPSGTPVNLTANGGGGDAFLCKYSADGSFLWAKAWGSTGLDRITRVALDTSGNVYASGEFQNTVDFNPAGPVHSNLTSFSANMNDAFLCKYAPDGSFLWAKAWGGARGDEAYDLAVNGTGNSYVVGDSTSPTIDFNPAGGHSWYTNYEYPSPTFFDAWLCKYDKDGNFKWVRAWGGNAYDDCCAVTLDGQGNVYVAGMFSSTNNTCDFNADTSTPHVPVILNAHGPNGAIVNSFLCKYDSNGAFQWAKAWGSTHNDPAQGLAADEAGNVYVAGYFSQDMSADGGPHDTVNFNPTGPVHSNLTSRGGGDAYLCKYAPNGTFQWVKAWGGPLDDAPGKIALDRSGNVLVTGYFQNTVDFDPGQAISNLLSQGGKDIFFSMFDSNGSFILAKACGGTGNDFGEGVAVDAAGNAYMTGSFAGTVDFDTACGSGQPARASNGDNDAYLCALTTDGTSGSSIPTLSEWGLLIMFLLIVAWAVWKIDPRAISCPTP